MARWLGSRVVHVGETQNTNNFCFKVVANDTFQNMPPKRRVKQEKVSPDRASRSVDTDGPLTSGVDGTSEPAVSDSEVYSSASKRRVGEIVPELPDPKSSKTKGAGTPPWERAASARPSSAPFPPREIALELARKHNDSTVSEPVSKSKAESLEPSTQDAVLDLAVDLEQKYVYAISKVDKAGGETSRIR